MELFITVAAVAALAIILYLLFKVFKFITRLILIVIFLTLAYFTNPSVTRHETAVYNEAEKKGVSLKGWTVNRMDLRIASITRISDGETQKVIGLGAFTRVWLSRDLPNSH